MKKLLVLVVLALVAPAMAASVVVSSPADGEILLTADAGIVGIGLTVDDGSIDSFAVDSFFDIFIDDYLTGNANPAADQLAAGPETMPSSSFSISVGGLDDDGIGSGSEEAPLVTTITLTPTAGTTSVTVDEDTLRGGIVGYDGAMTITGLPLTVNFGAVVDCVKIDAPFYDEWVGAGKNWEKPDCWCYERQCRGDADGKKEGLLWVSNNDLTTFAAAFGLGDLKLNQTLICADLDHKKVGLNRVQNDDLTIFAQYFGLGQLKVPVCPKDWDGDLDDDYNDWIVPTP